MFCYSEVFSNSVSFLFVFFPFQATIGLLHYLTILATLSTLQLEGGLFSVGNECIFSP